MQMVFAVIAAAVLGVAVCLNRRSRRDIDGEQVGESWLRESRADKRRSSCSDVPLSL